MDAGHGGNDNGAVSINGINEKDINLLIAKKIEELAPEYGIMVKMTRTKDEALQLQDRMDYIKNVQPDACISVHVNNNDEQQTSKNEVDVFVTRNEKSNVYQQSCLLGSSLLQNVKKNFQINKNLSQRKQLGIYVLDQNPYPVALIECGYMNNPANVKELSNNSKIVELARDILEGVVGFANADKNTSAKVFKNDLINPQNKTIADTTPVKITSLIINGDKRMFTSHKKDSILVILDGKVIDTNDSNLLMKAHTFSGAFLTGNAAMKKYGMYAKNGVFELESKNVNDVKNTSSSYDTPETDTLTDPVQTSPSFPAVKKHG